MGEFKGPTPIRVDIPPRLTVGVVGVGRAGAVLGAALARAGHQVIAAHAVSNLSQLRAAQLLPGVPLLPAEKAVSGVDLALITVPDDVLTQVIHGLSAAGSFHPGQLVVHSSGRYGISILHEATAARTIPLAIHPIMTLTGTKLDLQRLNGVSFGITATASARPIAEALVVEMGGEPVWVPEANRVLYHAALANSANHLTTLVAQSMELLQQAEVADPASCLGPLLAAALDNVLREGDRALTGPVARGDAGTVSAHIEAIESVAPIAAQGYRSLARLTADRALNAGLLQASAAEALLDALAEASPRKGSGPTGRTGSSGASATGISLVATRPQLAAALATATGPRAVAMTMGALHEGHLSLIETARREVGPNGQVVVTIFVNPLQFGANEDLDSYPRSLEADLRLCAEASADFVFAPTPATVYPKGQPSITIDPGRLGGILEGTARPGHFSGVLTVVAKLLELTQPDIAVFGEKDYQQLVLIRQMVNDLDLGVRVVAASTIRDTDGLAKSSRNSYLSPADRQLALAIPAAITAGRVTAGSSAAGSTAGSASGDPARLVVESARQALLNHAAEIGQPEGVELDYIVVTDPDLGPAPAIGPARLLIAARVAGVRLLDNTAIELKSD